jgi:SNF2 family DNA or RNA helicase
MKVLHCAWIPDVSDTLIQAGDFWLWIEDSHARNTKRKNHHRRSLIKTEIIEFMTDSLGLVISPFERRFNFASKTLPLPTLHGSPLPSIELDPKLDGPTETFEIHPWEIDAYKQTRPISQLTELKLLAFNKRADCRLGSDFQFWFWFCQSIKGLITSDRYIPALSPLNKLEPHSEIFPGWEFVTQEYDRLIREAQDCMPTVCSYANHFAYDKESLLRQCAETVLHQSVIRGLSGTRVEKEIRNTVLESACQELKTLEALESKSSHVLYKGWKAWRQRLSVQRDAFGFTLVFKIIEAEDESGIWQIEILLEPSDEAGSQVPIKEIWSSASDLRKDLDRRLGNQMLKNLLLSLGQAARIYPPLWEALDQSHPSTIELTTQEAFEFLMRDAWVMEDAGFTVLIPEWWTPQGRKRPRIRLKPRQDKEIGPVHHHYLDLRALTSYRYELSLGDRSIDPTEWQQLVESKSPLVRYQGRWLALDQHRMREMLAFWHKQQNQEGTPTLSQLILLTSEDPDFLEVEPELALGKMMMQLRDTTKLEPAENPRELKTALREYQKRGLAWVSFLESLGLNGCLADDMGLGKTVQVLARLLQERESAIQPGPTLLIAPTSVIGNWKKEIEQFAPSLKTFMHHGSNRNQTQALLIKEIEASDLVITSYAVSRRDEKLLSSVHWHRVVLDEAQNIKNPTSAQTKAAQKLMAKHRLALTGTPVENRLRDLWSIFHFLNPGYLGKQTHFRQRYELPIQKDNDALQAETLKRLIEPFVLRRVKTDPQILSELPEKFENRQYCNLSKEQAALYEAVVRDVEQRLTQVEGINRQGLMLSTLTKLKQICNHPSQFLQETQTLKGDRSPKLERLLSMLDEVLGEGESALVFTQFSAMGSRLESFLRHHLSGPVFYLDGSCPTHRRERLIREFQDPESGPAVFVLSLKAGGVGINLTKANHVFHFDRWWNPAVEDQATDRAFRIGQDKNVFVHKFITLGTLEERIDQMIEDKKSVASRIVAADESWLTHLDNEKFKSLIELNHQSMLSSDWP